MNSTREEIGGVMVTYHPGADFGERLGAIAREVGSLIVVDNSDASAQERVRALCTGLGCESIANPKNLGLATALNQAFRRHAERGLEWAVAFDQDSTPAPGCLATLLAFASEHPGCAAIGANWHDEARPESASRHLRRAGWFFSRQPAREDLSDVTCVITSGTLFHLPTWRAIGGFDETLFLDLVDTEYCLRARAAGHRVAVAAAARLAHRRGSKRPVNFLGRTFWPAFMPPSRLHYLFRNRMRLLPRYLFRVPHWIAFELIYAAKIIGEIVFLETDKFAKLAACARGTWDGLMGRGGPIR